MCEPAEKPWVNNDLSGFSPVVFQKPLTANPCDL